MNTNWLIALVGLASGAFSAWWVTADHYQGDIAKEHEAQQELVIEQQEKNYAGFVAYAERIVKAGADHDKNAIIVRNLRRKLDRMRVQFPVCSVPDTAEAEGDSNGAARILSNAVDAEFAAFQERTGELIERCDRLNIDAIRANSQIGD